MKKNIFNDYIIFENEDFIAVNKPAGLSSLDDRTGNSTSIIRLAKEYNENLQLCHRLDKETSGVLLLAKHSATYRDASILFENRKMNKTYHAICCGSTNFQNQLIDFPLKETRSGRAVIDATGKEAKTFFTTLKNFRHYSLVECKPITGRLHQIRIHLATQNASIVADEIYGGKFPYLSAIKKKYKTSKTDEEESIMKRVALHAFSIQFEHKEKNIFIEATYPKDMGVFISLLEKYDN